MPRRLAVERYFGDLPVVDAKAPLRIFPNKRDISKAKPKNPAHCVFAESCRRMYGATKIMFLRTTAFIDLPDRNGKRKVNRFVLQKDVRQQIAKFDRTRKADPGGYELSPPSPGMTLDAKLSYTRRRMAKIRKGLHKVVPRGNSRNTRPLTGTLQVRDGRGDAQFIV